MTPRCPHRNTYYYLDPTTEAGWKCVDCSKALGFRPDLDRKRLDVKVEGILLDLAEAKIIYVSNATMGDIIVSNVALRIRQINSYDQLSIARLILLEENVDVDGHALYWREEANKVLTRRGLRAVKPKRGGPTLWERARARPSKRD